MTGFRRFSTALLFVVIGAAASSWLQGVIDSDGVVLRTIGTVRLAAAQGTPATQPGRVWVNTSSKVYHCPGTRYYGNTARGAYMTEAEARAKGNRPAYGKTCGLAVASSVTTGADVKVWVNTSSKVYHCPGTRYYGTTKKGTYMRQQDAQAAGHRPAAGRICS